MRCQRLGAAISAAMLWSACGGGDGSVAAGGMDMGNSQTSGQTSSVPMAPMNAGGAGDAAQTTSGPKGNAAAAGSGAKPAGATSAAPGMSTSSGGASGASANAGMTVAAGSAAPGGAAGDGAAGSAGMAAAATDDCDRACLLEIMQQYLDALVAHDPSTLKTAASLKVTDNGVEAKLGDGLFKTGTMVLEDHRLDFADPMLGNVATQVVVNEGNTGVIYQARLKVEKREITEIESMTVHRADAANGFFNIDNMKPEPAFLEDVPAEKRMTRDKLEEITELYLDYLEGKKRGPDVPFDEGCKRYENGQVTASGLSSFNGQSWSFQVTRRILVIDEEAQITWGMFPFTQAADTLVVGEAFKIVEGKIMMIQAVMAYQPAKVWD